jgi:hypothetical protein
LDTTARYTHVAINVLRTVMSPLDRLTLPEEDRGRERRLSSVPPPSEPDLRISRIRLSSRWSYLQEDRHAAAWAVSKQNNPSAVKKALGQRD